MSLKLCSARGIKSGLNTFKVSCGAFSIRIDTDSILNENIYWTISRTLTYVYLTLI